MYKSARKKAGLTIEEAAFRIPVAQRTLCKYEAEQSIPAPDVVLAMSRVYKEPALTMLHCRKNCEIGQAYNFEVLNNVDTSPTAIITKYRQENSEAAAAVEKLALLMLNKSGRSSCTEDELRQIWTLALELLDLQHVIEVMKIRLWDYIDVGELTKTHNNKCAQKRYYDPARPELQMAG